MYSERKKKILFIMLDMLREEALHGYGLAERISKIYGIEKPSSGIIYPVLSSLKRNGYVEIAQEGKRDKKIYRITERGKEFLEQHSDEVSDAKQLLTNIGKFEKMGGRKMMSDIGKLIASMHTLSHEDLENLEHFIAHTTKKLEHFIERGRDE